jgi:hypothetical protein
VLAAAPGSAALPLAEAALASANALGLAPETETYNGVR